MSDLKPHEVVFYSLWRHPDGATQDVISAGWAREPLFRLTVVAEEATIGYVVTDPGRVIYTPEDMTLALNRVLDFIRASAETPLDAVGEAAGGA